MNIIDTSKHLYQPPLYQSKGVWFSDFNKALKNAKNDIHLDIAAIQSYLSFGYICGNRTLLLEVERQPWLSTIIDNNVKLEKIPSHGFFSDSYENLSKRLFNLLVEEAKIKTKHFKNIYVLLSGGLDSRIVAGILKQLYDAGQLKSKPIAVTWGLEDSRDVVYAKNIAGILDFEIIHITITPELVKKNINFAAKDLGLIHSPEMLHNMTWFKDLPENSIVLAGSFGDSIGRAEFGGKHLLQLKTPTPKDNFNLLKRNLTDGAEQEVKNDINKLIERSPQSLSYMHNEHFMQGFRMRGGLCHALSTINGNAEIYQMFTSPEVYSFIWSLHPSVRDDEIYKILFKNHLPALTNFPWARTNKALGAKTKGAINGLKYHYHEYTKWSKNELREDLENLVDIEWFKNFGIFNIESIISLRNLVRNSEVRVGRANDIWFWLAGFRVFVDNLEKSGKKVIIPNDFNKNEIFANKKKSNFITIAKNHILNKSTIVNGVLKKMRMFYHKYELRRIKQKYISKYPPVNFPK